MERLTKEREAQIRSDVASCAIDADDAAALLAEIDALRKEHDAEREARQRAEQRLNALSDRGGTPLVDLIERLVRGEVEAETRELEECAEKAEREREHWRERYDALDAFKRESDANAVAARAAALSEAARHVDEHWIGSDHDPYGIAVDIEREIRALGTPDALAAHREREQRREAVIAAAKALRDVDAEYMRDTEPMEAAIDALVAAVEAAR